MSLPAAMALSETRHTRIERIGAEKLSVAVVEDCLAQPEAAIDLAAAMPFTRIGPYYPGIRASLGTEAAAHLGAAFSSVIAESLGVSAKAWRGDCFFSIVATSPAQLMPIQRMPHFDGLEETRVAALLYLAKADFGGTSFYRHRTTGFETVDASRYPAYGAALKAEVERNGPPLSDYIGDGGALFEEIANFEPVFNRLLLYRGNALHCSRIRNASALNADPRKGRLTLTVFLEPA